MRYAIDKNNKRIEAQKGIQAFCPICNEEVVAKCGKVKIPHWAHKQGGDCDTWSENKTQWHIDWQDCFPKDMQEYILYDEKTNEKHIADIYTPDKFVIEFQHSYIREDERLEREIFYTKNGRKLVWVVDGNRLKTTYEKFEHIKFCSVKDDEYRNFVLCENECWSDTRYVDIFPENWLTDKAPVFFDFELKNEKSDPLRKFLWCLFPEKVNGKFVVMCITKERFINHINSGKPFINLLKVKYDKLSKIYNDNIIDLSNKLPSIELSYIKIVQAKNKELSWKKYLQIGDIYIYGDPKIYKQLDMIVVDCIESYNEWKNKKKIKHDKSSKIVQNAIYNGENIISSNGNKLKRVVDVLCLIKNKDTFIPALFTLNYNDYKKSHLKDLLNWYENKNGIPVITMTSKKSDKGNYFSPSFFVKSTEENNNLQKLISKMQEYSHQYVFT